MRAFTIGNFVDDNGRIVINAWARAFKVSDQSLVETQYSDTSGNISFVALGDTDDIFIIVMWGNPKNTRYFWSEAPATMDEIQEGSTYGKVRNTQISSGLIYLTENQNMTGQGFVVESASSGARCALTSTGLKTYDATTQRVNISNDGSGWFGSSTAFAWTTGGVVTVTGVTIQTVNANAKVVIDSTGLKAYDATPTQRAQILNDGSGWFGTSTAFAWTAGGVITATGITVQSASSGERAILSSTGLTIVGGKLILQDANAANSAALYIDTSGYLRVDSWTYTRTAGIIPTTSGTYTLGTSDLKWSYIYCNVIELSNDILADAGGSANLGSSTLYFNKLWASYLQLDEANTPGATASFGALYTKSDNLLYFQSGDGVEHTVAFA